jgi:hypothetical protein
MKGVVVLDRELYKIHSKQCCLHVYRFVRRVCFFFGWAWLDTSTTHHMTGWGSVDDTSLYSREEWNQQDDHE